MIKSTVNSAQSITSFQSHSTTTTTSQSDNSGKCEHGKTHILNHVEAAAADERERARALYQHWNSVAVKNGVWFKQKMLFHIQNENFPHCISVCGSCVLFVWKISYLFFNYHLLCSSSLVDTGGKFIHSFSTQAEAHQSEEEKKTFSHSEICAEISQHGL